RLRELFARYGGNVVHSVLEDVLDYTERRARALVRSIPDGTYRAETQVEGDGVTTDDITIACTTEIRGDRIGFDFGGTAPAAPRGRRHRHLPPRGDRARLPLRPARAAAERRPDQRRPCPSDRDRRAERLPRQRTAPVRRCRRQRRD